MENETNKLKRELEWKEKTHRKDLLAKEKELEALKKEMDRFIEDLTGGAKGQRDRGAKDEGKGEFTRPQKTEEPVSTENVVETVLPPSRVSEEVEEKNVDAGLVPAIEKPEPKKSFLDKLFGR
jgi:Glu-tRNA(Gln) amidotransferase subunit E-like FAD-binding protein